LWRGQELTRRVPIFLDHKRFIYPEPKSVSAQYSDAYTSLVLFLFSRAWYSLGTNVRTYHASI
jgi:hypothetical protein